MAPKKCRRLPHTDIVIPGETGDPLADPLRAARAVKPQSVCQALQQGDVRVDAHLSAGMTVEKLSRISIPPHLPLRGDPVPSPGRALPHQGGGKSWFAPLSSSPLDGGRLGGGCFFKNWMNPMRPTHSLGGVCGHSRM